MRLSQNILPWLVVLFSTGPTAMGEEGLTFYAPFDGDLRAAVAKGDPVRLLQPGQ